MTPVLLELRNVARRHPTEPRWLLDHVSLALRAGDRFAVSGPSGAGKTLLLRSMILLDPFDQGEVLWRDRPLHPAEIPDFRRSAIYLHQRAVLPCDSSHGETVEDALRRPFSLAIHRQRSFDRPKILALLESLKRGATFLEQPVSGLSGGEIQMTALLRAVQLDPMVLLLDEPTAAIDPAAAAAVEQLVDRWWTEKPQERALIWVTHDAAQAQRVADRTMRMENGKFFENTSKTSEE
jgi:putative ABC transport system ATP-binding protein